MVYRGETVAGVTLLDRQEAVRDLESRLRRALLIARLGGERLISRGGRLEILRSLGYGASGVVCEALDRKLGRKVALKLYPGIAQDRLAAAVRTEAQMLAALKHRNIVVVHDFDAEEFRPGEIRCFLVVMELLSGTTLRHWMAEPRPIGDIVEVFCRAGDGLAAAHAREIVHRDFKPENVMLDDDGEPRLVDFGLALLDVPATGQLDSSDPEQRAIVGTLAYMAPEALRGRADARSDQFSFAAALWEALHGDFPYRIDDLDPNHRVVSATSRSEKLPPALVDCLRHALAPDPLRRFPKIADLIAHLRQLQGELRAASSSASVPAIPAAINLMSDTNPSAATTSAPAVPRRSWAWLAFPAFGAASVAGVLVMTGFWDSEEEPDLAVAADEPEDAAPPEAPSTPPPAPVAAFSCLASTVGQKWLFHTSSQWANERMLLDKVGRYDLLLSPTDQKNCRFSAMLRKYGPNDRLSTDKQDLTIEALPPFTAGATQEFTLDGYIYDFFFIFDGNQIRGDFRARGVSDQFFGLLQGGRTESDRKTPKLDDQPCAAQCGVRCLGAKAIARCREQCGADRTARPVCEAPDDDAKLTLPSWSTNSADCPAGTDPWFDATWVVHARTRRGEDRSAHRYELRLDAETCHLELADAQKDGAPWPVVGRGKITGDRRWELELRGEGFQHTWILAGWDPVFGTFKTTPTDGTGELTRGVLAAYRQP